MKAAIQRGLLSMAIAPLAVAFFLIACAMAGPREAVHILKRRSADTRRSGATVK